MDYKTIYESLKTPVLIADVKTGKIIECNRAAEKLTGYCRHEIIGMHQKQFHPSRETEKYKRMFKEHTDLGEKIQLEASVERKDGTIIPINIHAQVVKMFNKEIIIGVFTDITIQKNAEKARDALTKMTVHDLRNPLSIIQGYTNLFLMNMPENNGAENEKMRMDLLVVKKLTDQMSSMITDILDLANFESGKISLKLDDIDLVSLAKELTDELQVEFGKGNIKLNFSTSTEKIIVKTDRKMLIRIIQNLLTNVLNHAASASQVDFEIEYQKDKVVFIIKDDGPGILPEHKDKIFEKFFKTSTGKTVKHYGSGLGLAFCKMAIESLNGEIWVESEKGKGATFSFYIR